MRRCTQCNEPMMQGYCIESGFMYFCSEGCLENGFGIDKFHEWYEDGGETYWTEWECYCETGSESQHIVDSIEYCFDCGEEM